MSEEIIKVLDALAEKFGLVIDWTSSNVIPYLETLCSKYVNYEIVTSVIWIVIGILCCGVGSIFISKVNKNKEFGVEHNTYWDDALLRCLVYAGLIVFIAYSVLCILSQVFDIATCITFPEKIILNEITTLYTNMK